MRAHDDKPGYLKILAFALEHKLNFLTKLLRGLACIT